MKNKFLKLYLTIFTLIIFFSSAIFIYEQINKLSLPKGIISVIINYGYFLIHIISFVALLYYGKEVLITTNKRD